jgi:hypothetical protein
VQVVHLKPSFRLSFGKARILSNLQLSTLISEACVQLWSQLWSVTTFFLIASQLINIFGNGVQVQSGDCKMKFEAASVRETTQQHFGKRGMSWHGCLFVVFRRNTLENGSVIAERINIYIDQILDDGNNQDNLAICSMIEAALEVIHEQLPEIKAVVLQSDDAKCYQNNLIRILLALLNTRSAIRVERYIFTETQDGKGLIDAHFTICMAHLKRFMRTSQRNRIRAIATPAGLAYALPWNGGVQNSCVQLVRLDKEKLKLIEGLLKNYNNSLNKILPRCNDVFFFRPPSSQHKNYLDLK